MRRIHHLLILLCLLGWGCGNKVRSGPGSPPGGPGMMGPQTYSPAAQANTPPQGILTVRGQVRNPVVPWTQGMTLVQAIIAADYIGRWDPVSIAIVRNGQPSWVDPKRLLRGSVDPPVFPGDMIELR